MSQSPKLSQDWIYYSWPGPDFTWNSGLGIFLCYSRQVWFPGKSPPYLQQNLKFLSQFHDSRMTRGGLGEGIHQKSTSSSNIEILDYIIYLNSLIFDLSLAYQKSQDCGLSPVWVKEEEVTALTPTKTDVFVLDPFEGPAFEHVTSDVKFRCVCWRVCLRTFPSPSSTTRSTPRPCWAWWSPAPVWTRVRR